MNVAPRHPLIARSFTMEKGAQNSFDFERFSYHQRIDGQVRPENKSKEVAPFYCIGLGRYVGI